MKKPHKDKAKFDRCLAHVKGKVRNPYAVCNASGAGRAERGKKGRR